MKAAKVGLVALVERCTAPGLVHAAEALGELLEEAARENLSAPGFLRRLLEQ
jgi:hypothetical protein